jgi:hypothetical protein
VSTVRAGAQAPERVRMSVANTSGDPEPLDLSTVTAVTVRVTRGSYTPVTWECDTLSHSSTLIELERVFDPSDVEFPGRYRLDFILAVPSGIRRAGPVYLTVTP